MRKTFTTLGRITLVIFCIILYITILLIQCIQGSYMIYKYMNTGLWGLPNHQYENHPDQDNADYYWGKYVALHAIPRCERISLGGGLATVRCYIPGLPSNSYELSYSVKTDGTTRTYYRIQITKHAACNIEALRNWDIEKIQLCSIDYNGIQHRLCELLNQKIYTNYGDLYTFNPYNSVPRKIIAEYKNKDVINIFIKNVLDNKTVNEKKPHGEEADIGVCVLRVIFSEYRNFAWETLIILRGDRSGLKSVNKASYDAGIIPFWVTKGQYNSTVIELPLELEDFILQSVPEQDWIYPEKE